MVKKKKGASEAGEAAHRKVPCRCCATLPYQGQRLIETALGPGDVQFDFESGMYELIMRMNVSEEEVFLDNDVADRLADRATRYQAKLQTQFAQNGLLEGSRKRNRVRPLAPFDLDELKLGTIMGTGGFSSVVEVEQFESRTGADEGLKSHQKDARQFLTTHAQRSVDSSISQTQSIKDRKSRTTSRYGIKFIRKGLLLEPERFERAAMDLVLETQLLLAMDHPNILAIRGLSREGPAGYRSGRCTSYFVIVDRLPETLDDKIWEWRNRLRKYKTRAGLPWGKNKYLEKIGALMRTRVRSCLSMAAALRYMHDLRIINRDFKAANVGFDIFGELKIFDFGLSRVLPPEEEREPRGYIMSRVGTKYYMAPEVAEKTPYDVSADVYSFGVVVWEVLTMSTPREALKKCHHLIPENEMCPLPICPCWPKMLGNLVRNCVSDLPEDRPTMIDNFDTIESVLDELGDPIVSEDTVRQRRRSTVRIDLSELKDDDADALAGHSDNLNLQAAPVSDTERTEQI